MNKKNFKILSPLRYPGSKRKLLPKIMPVLEKLKGIPENFSDVFVGGGNVTLAVAEAYPNTNISANDKDPRIAAIWNVTASSDVYKFVDNLDVEPNVELFNYMQSRKFTSDMDLAVQGFLLNRMSFSGMLNGGPIGGIDQEGKYKIGSHYNYPDLKEKILNCHELLADRTVVTCKDFRDVLPKLPEDTAVYLDPPYVLEKMKSNLLYPVGMSNEDHCELASLLDERNNFVLSYDDSGLSRSLYSNLDVLEIPVKYSIRNTPVEKTELLYWKIDQGY